MSKMFQVYGIGQALIPVLPPPLPFENAPNNNQTNYEIGQLVFTPPQAPTAFYLYAGAGNWVQFASSSGDILAINGTANQITASTVSGVATLSLPSAITTPGSLTTTTTLTAGTGITAITGNLTLSGVTSKVNINVSAPTTASAGTTAALTAGTIVVSTTAITANSLVFFATHTLGTVTVPQAYRVSARTPGTSFTIQSQDATDTSTVDYWIIN